MSLIKILVTNRSSGEQKPYNLSQNVIVIGRQGSCDIVLDSVGVSRRHAQIILHRQLSELEDLGSGNGTILNQQKIKGKERMPLKSGDQIRIEEYDIDLEIPEQQIAAAHTEQTHFDITDPDIIEIKMIKKVLGALDQDKQPSVIVASEPFKNRKAIFEEGLEELIIGRDANCHLALDAPVISRKHATITIKWGGYVLTDLSSKNGTFINGERIEEKSLHDGDEIVFGTIKAVFKNPQEFDIESIARSIAKSKEKAAKPADLENTSEFLLPELVKKPDAVPLQAAKPAAKNKEPLPDDLDFTEPPPAKPAVLEILRQDTPFWEPLLRPLKRFSPLELTLFGLGGFVFLLALILLLSLLT